MAADVFVEVTDRIKESLHELPDESFLDHIKYPQSCPRGVIEYKYVSQIFSELKKASKYDQNWAEIFRPIFWLLFFPDVSFSVPSP